MLDKDRICMAIDELGRPLVEEVEVLKSVDSTNSYLLTQPLKVGLARVCATEMQRAGRGRRGNEWQSAANKNIMMSLSWGFPRWLEGLTGLGLAASLVVAERLNKDYSLDVKIKWPNDLMVEKDKLAGILIDVSGDPHGYCNVVIGLGLNVHQADWSESEAGYAWQDLHRLGVEMDRSKFIGQLTSDLVAMLQTFERQGFAPMVQRWNDLSSYTGKQVVILDGGESVRGLMQGVSDVGALIVKLDSGEQRVYTDSNISVRLQG
jgi:BirA family biotin operon repressor/biotin-[acetyl-CoA-carboxylase] ligase